MTGPLSVSVVVTSLTTIPLPLGSQLAVRFPFGTGWPGVAQGCEFSFFAVQDVTVFDCAFVVRLNQLGLQFNLIGGVS